MKKRKFSLGQIPALPRQADAGTPIPRSRVRWRAARLVPLFWSREVRPGGHGEILELLQLEVENHQVKPLVMSLALDRGIVHALKPGWGWTRGSCVGAVGAKKSRCG